VGLANLGSESETCVGSRVHLVGVSISFEKNFYRLPLTPPLWFAVSVLQMAPFDALYGRRYRNLLNWSETGEMTLFGPDLVKDAKKRCE
jgi:hypothetical protein